MSIPQLYVTLSGSHLLVVTLSTLYLESATCGLRSLHVACLFSSLPACGFLQRTFHPHLTLCGSAAYLLLALFGLPLTCMWLSATHTQPAQGYLRMRFYLPITLCSSHPMCMSLSADHIVPVVGTLRLTSCPHVALGSSHLTCIRLSTEHILPTCSSQLVTCLLTAVCGSHPTCIWL